MSLSESEAERLHDASKVLFDDWEWSWTGVRYEESAPVTLEDENTQLRLLGWHNQYRYSFSLLYKNAYVVRRWGFDHPHRNPDGELIDEPHKHHHIEDHGDDWAYRTNDVTTSGVNQAFIDFLEEENIRREGAYQSTVSTYD